ncbi:hypothetical protein EBZ80_06650 [bacterium]|nr:hypothetical protein [bacterium]
MRFLWIVMPVVALAYAPSLPESFRLVRDLSLDHGIDDSHNERHSKEVLFWSIELLRRSERPLSRREHTRIATVALLHDLVDPKYEGDREPFVEQHLIRWFRPEERLRIMEIMKTMSYRKTFTGDGFVFPNGSSHEYHVPREADLLASYNLARMVEYRRACRPEMTNYDIRQDMKEYFRTRTGRLIEDGAFVSDAGRTLARSLHEVAALRMAHLVPLLDLENDLALLRIVDGLSLDRLLDSLDALPVACTAP